MKHLELCAKHGTVPIDTHTRYLKKTKSNAIKVARQKYCFYCEECCAVGNANAEEAKTEWLARGKWNRKQKKMFKTTENTKS